LEYEAEKEAVLERVVASVGPLTSQGDHLQTWRSKRGWMGLVSKLFKTPPGPMGLPSFSPFSIAFFFVFANQI
jgi:hypothetical protein